MTPIERQILLNQEAIMMALRELSEVSLLVSNDFLLKELGSTNILIRPDETEDKDGKRFVRDLMKTDAEDEDGKQSE